MPTRPSPPLGPLTEHLEEISRSPATYRPQRDDLQAPGGFGGMLGMAEDQEGHHHPNACSYGDCRGLRTSVLSEEGVHGLSTALEAFPWLSEAHQDPTLVLKAPGSAPNATFCRLGVGTEQTPHWVDHSCGASTTNFCHPARVRLRFGPRRDNLAGHASCRIESPR